jgi:hypothetical protein
MLVVAQPVPLYFSGYVFHKRRMLRGLEKPVTWAATAASIIVLLLLIESRAGIIKVLKRIGQGLLAEEVTERNIYYAHYSTRYQKRILVPVDGSQQSLRALDYAASIYSSNNTTTSNFHDKVMITLS